MTYPHEEQPPAPYTTPPAAYQQWQQLQWQHHPPQYQRPAWPAPPPPMTRYAIPSVVLALLAIPAGWVTLCLGAVGLGLVAAICGHIGEVETRDGTRRGRALAMAGAALGWLSPLLSLASAAVLGFLAD